MYGACTQRMRLALSLDFLDFLPWAFLGISLLVWSLVFYGALGDASQRLRGVLNGPR